MKLANPFYYPIAVLLGGITLFGGVRLAGLSNKIILPVAAAVTVASASVLKSREPGAKTIAQKQLERELQLLKQSAKSLALKAEELREEANKLLAQSSTNFDFLVVIQQACNRAIEIPEQLEKVARSLPEQESLLSVRELESQLAEVQKKLNSSSGLHRQHLEQLAASLQRNIQLAQTGQDTRQAKIVSLYTTVQNLAGALQQLQNKLRTADLNDWQNLQELRSLSEDMNGYQDRFDLLIFQS